MTAREEGHGPVASALQGLRFDALSGDERERVLADAFDYRGDVTLSLDDGSSLTGYVFSLESRTPEPYLLMLPAAEGSAKTRVALRRIVGCAFSGRDTADGRSWEAWVKRWEEKQRLREQGVDVGDIEPKPSHLE
jgi:hypothetical protein